MLIIFVVIIVCVFFGILLNNSLVGKKNSCENAFASIDAQLKKRYDLIPNLVSCVKEYMKHERETLEVLTSLRTKALNAEMSSDERIQIDNQINKVLGGIMIAVENYPDLKASENMDNLQRSLNEVEAQIAASRRAYNAAVTSYNNAVEMFPSNIIANFRGYRRRETFVIDASERENIDIEGQFNK